MKFRCPICHKTITIAEKDRLESARYLPFCSQRCKLIDLGAWLDSQYKISAESDEQCPEQNNDG